MDKKVFEIKETTNYDQFRFAKNRAIDRVGINKAKANILATGKKCVLPVVVNSKGIVRDGQHRIHACQELGVPVRYFVTDEIKDKHVPVIQNGRKWGLLNYVVRHAEEGLEDFQYLHNAFQVHGKGLLGIGSFGVLFIGRSFTTKDLSNKEFKLSKQTRTFFNKNISKLNEIFLANTQHNSALRTEKWVKAISLLLNNEKYNHEHFINRLETTTKTLMTSRQQEPINNALLELYNEKLPVEQKIEKL